MKPFKKNNVIIISEIGLNHNGKINLAKIIIINISSCIYGSTKKKNISIKEKYEEIS